MQATRALALACLLSGCSTAPHARSGGPNPSAAAVVAASTSAMTPSKVDSASSVARAAPTSSAQMTVTGPERLTASLTAPSDALLLLGLHLESIEGYSPMFSSEGKPKTDVRPGYRTLLIETGGGTADIVGELPFLAVPRPEGFLFLGEASVSVHLPNDPSVTLFDGSPKPRDFDATKLFRTTRIAQVEAEQRSLVAALGRRKAWGVEDTEQIVYVTQNAVCTVHTESEVTGGALWFRATSTLGLAALGAAPVAGGLTSYLDEAVFKGFAAKLLELDVSDIDLERPYMFNTFDLIVWRDDVVACLEHERGATLLTGSVRVSGNSARSFSKSAIVGPAPPSIAPGKTSVDFDAVLATIPDAVDAFVSPSHDVVLALVTPKDQPAALVVWDVANRRERKRLPIFGRPVMDEWAIGDVAAHRKATLAERKATLAEKR